MGRKVQAGPRLHCAAGDGVGEPGGVSGATATQAEDGVRAREKGSHAGGRFSEEADRGTDGGINDDEPIDDRRVDDP